MHLQLLTWNPLISLKNKYLNKYTSVVNNTAEVIFMSVVRISGDNFENEVLSSKIPVLVDFYASWCTPCRMMKPLLEDLSDELIGEVKVAKVDVMAETELAGDFRILNVPTMKVFCNGEVTDTLIGATGKEQLLSILKSHTV